MIASWQAASGISLDVGLTGCVSGVCSMGDGNLSALVFRALLIHISIYQGFVASRPRTQGDGSYPCAPFSADSGKIFDECSC